MPPSVSRLTRRSAVLASAFAALVSVPAQAAGECPGAERVPSPAVSAADLRSLACAVDHERRRRGRPALRRVRTLDRAAARHSADMGARGYFDHRSPGGSMPADRARDTGYLHGARSWRVAENIAWGAGPAATPASIVQTWLRSPPHRAILLAGDVPDAGVGIASGAPQGGMSRGATYTLLVGSTGG